MRCIVLLATVGAISFLCACSAPNGRAHGVSGVPATAQDHLASTRAGQPPRSAATSSTTSSAGTLSSSAETPPGYFGAAPVRGPRVPSVKAATSPAPAGETAAAKAVVDAFLSAVSEDHVSTATALALPGQDTLAYFACQSWANAAAAFKISTTWTITKMTTPEGGMDYAFVTFKSTGGQAGTSYRIYEVDDTHAGWRMNLSANPEAAILTADAASQG